MMTIQDLHDTCDNLNLYTKVFIVDSDRTPLLWNKMFLEVSYDLLQLKVEYFKIAGNEVIIWVP